MSLGGVTSTVGMVGKYVAWGVGGMNLGGRSTSALAQLLGPPPPPARPQRTSRGALGVLLMVLGALFVLGAPAGAATSAGNAAVAAAVGLAMVAGGILLKVQDSRIRDAAFAQARAHHGAAFTLWSALYYCARCDSAWHPTMGSLGPSVAVPHALHAAATSALSAAAPVTLLNP